MSVAMTLNPRRANSAAVARPRPCAAPVTKATFKLALPQRHGDESTSARDRWISVRHVGQKEAAIGSGQKLARIPQLVLVSLEGARCDHILGTEAFVEVDEQLLEQPLVDVAVTGDVRSREQTALGRDDPGIGLDERCERLVRAHQPTQ